MIIDQALFGETDHGHDLIAGSITRMTAQLVAGRTDLPDVIPAGVEPPSYVCGFRADDLYVLARVAIDQDASRSGMVRAHAAVLPLDVAASVDDLASLLQRLDPFADPGSVQQPMNWSPSSAGASSPLLRSAAVILSGTAPHSVVVDDDAAGFETLVANLWANMTPRLRQQFSFRLSLSPRDLGAKEPQLVLVPHSLTHQYLDSSIATSQARAAKLSPGASLLAGEASAVEFLEFAQELGNPIGEFADLEEFGDLFQQAHSENVEDLIDALRFLAHRLPHRSSGRAVKKGVSERFIAASASSKIHQILTLRNLDLGAFDDAGGIWASITSRVARAGFNEWQKLISALAPGQATADWQNAIWEALKQNAAQDPQGQAKQIWRWREAESSFRGEVFEKLHGNSALDVSLAETIPKTKDLGDLQRLQTELAAFGWPATHGALLRANLPLHEAAEAQAAAFNGEHLDAVFTGIDGQTIVTEAAAYGQSSLIERAIAVASQDPATLSGIDLQNHNAQRIWSGALGNNLDAWRGPRDPTAAITLLLQDLVDGVPMAPDLLERLSHTPLADLSGALPHDQIWTHLRGATRERFIAATADGWLNRLASGLHRVTPEVVISRALIEPLRLTPFLDTCAVNNPGVGIQFFLEVPDADEQLYWNYVSYILRVQTSLNPETAKSIGNTAAIRGWNRAASSLLETFKEGRGDLQPALSPCAPMFGFFDRIWYGIGSISRGEKFEGLMDIATQLYPDGPDEDDLWERAGGRKSDLQRNGSGAARWRYAVRGLEQGRWFRPSHLIAEMIKDFPRHPTLIAFSKDSEFLR